MGTVAVPISTDEPDYADPNVVKVVINKENYAIYFSRSPIPFLRGPDVPQFAPLKHWGIYIFHKAFLKKFIKWPQGTLERAEKLEQLRALENGAKILVTVTSGTSTGVDVPKDVHKVEKILLSENGSS